MAFESAASRGFSGAALFVALLAGTSPARAASPETCKHLEEVARRDPKLPTLIELAECSEKAGDVVAAQAQWALARDRAKHDEKPQSRAKAEQRLAAVAKRVAHLTLQLAGNAPAGAQVLRDDLPLDAAALANALPMNPGDHVIFVKLAGHDDAKYPVKLADGDNQTLAIAVGPASSGPPAASPPAAAPALAVAPPLAIAPNVAAEPAKPEAPAPTGWWSTPRTVGVIAGLTGLVAVGGGSVLCVLASKDAKAGFKVDQRTALGGLSIVTGSVLLISGVALLATASTDAAPQHARITVAPTLLLARNATLLGAAGEF